MAKGPTKVMQIKTISILLTVTIVFGAAIFRLGYIVFARGEEYSKAALEQQLRDVVLSPDRGDIYDKNMELLATSATVWLAYISPQNFKKDKDGGAAERELAAKNLSEILELDYEKVLTQTKKNTGYEIIKRGVEQPEADKIRKFILENDGMASIIGLDKSTKRYYPDDNNLLSTVLGFVGSDNQGLSGLESFYEEALSGVPGRVVAAKNARGSDMPFMYETMVEAKAGNSLVLTVDKYIQYFAEKYLEQAVIDNGVKERGSVIVMDVKTGGILAMATKPDFNPNDPFTVYDEAERQSLESLKSGGNNEAYLKALNEARNKQWRNKNISDVYEPGSVFKIITGAAAIEENKVNLNSGFSCPGHITIAGTRYKCHQTRGHGALNLTSAFEKSCNPAFIEMGQRLGVSTFYKYVNAFGLREKTGIDLLGEASSILHENPTVINLASSSFGQTINISPIQLITAIAATVNGGYLVQPHLVSREVDDDNKIVKKHEEKTKRQVISEKTVSTMKNLLERVVSTGSGKNSYVAGYKIGGKTGTSQKVADLAAGNEKEYIASFCGIAPMDDPQIAILLTLDTPTGAAYYGGTIAAPAVGKIFAEVLPYMGIEPKYTDDELLKLDKKTPNLVGSTVAEATTKLGQEGLKIRVVGDGGSVDSQTPTYNQSIPAGGTVVVYTGGSTQREMTAIPDFKGLSLTEVRSKAEENKLNIKISGNTTSSVAYSQSTEAGKVVEAWTTVTVDFRSKDITD